MRVLPGRRMIRVRRAAGTDGDPATSFETQRRFDIGLPLVLIKFSAGYDLPVLNQQVGGAVTLAGEYVYHSKAMVTVGTGAVLIAGGIYFVFRWLGRREARRREAAATGHERPERLED